MFSSMCHMCCLGHAKSNVIAVIHEVPKLETNNSSFNVSYGKIQESHLDKNVKQSILWVCCPSAI